MLKKRNHQCTIYRQTLLTHLHNVAQLVKNLPALKTWVRSLGWEDPLAKGKATHCSILAWRIPRAEELTGYSPWGGKELDTTEHLHFFSVMLRLPRWR